MTKNTTPGKEPKKLKGLDTLFAKPEPFMIGERTFTFRMLGMRDTFTLLRILKSAFQMGFGEAKTMIGELMKELKFIPGAEGAAEEKKLRYALMLSPLLGIADVDFLILDFLGDVTREIIRDEHDKEVQVDVDVNDAETFPAGAEMVLIANLACHPSVEAYKAHFLVAKAKSPALVAMVEMGAGQLNS